MEIRSALFKAEINSVLQLPNNIVSTIRIDDSGYIWFITSCNGYYAGKIDRHFYGSLEYYQKGSDCHIKISGKATIVETADMTIEKVNSFCNDSNIALIKFKILQAEYFENRSTQTTITEKIKDYFTELFLPKNYRLFNFPEVT